MIASNIRVPGSYSEVDPSGANNGLPEYRQPILIVAPRIKSPSDWAGTTAVAVGATVKPTSAHVDGYFYICVTAGTTGSTEPTWPGAGGSVTSGTAVFRELVKSSDIIEVNIPVKCYSPDDGAKYGGAGSIAHRMVRAAFRQYRYAEVTLICVDDSGSGVHATATITITGTADGSGSAQFRIGNEPVDISWSDGDTASEIAAVLDAAIAAKHDLPISSSVSAGVVTQRTKNAGVPGNEIGKYDADATAYKSQVSIIGNGVSISIAGFASGANNPDITDALTAATSGEYALIAIPYKDDTNLAALEDFLGTVSDEVNCSGARAFIAATSNVSAGTTLSEINSERIHVGLVRKCKFTSFEIAAAYAAITASTGHPALPLNGLKLVDCDAPEIPDRLEWTEINSLLWNGVTPFNSDGMGDVRCVRSITTYTLSSTGSPDDTYLDTTVIANLDYMRKAIKTAHQLSFARKVLRENHVAGEPEFVVTPGDIRSFNIAKCKELEIFGVCQQVDVLKDQFVSERDANVSGRVNSDIPVEVVQGLHIIANTIRLTTTV
jgi:phage tail sheath gpL-like